MRLTYTSLYLRKWSVKWFRS